MKLFYNVFLLVALVIGGYMTSSAQVNKVQYQLRYNAVDTTYDMYLIVHEGSAKNPTDRTQFNAQISLLVPSATKLEITKLYMPLIDNFNYNGMTPLKWLIINTVSSPISMPKYDFISIVPQLALSTSRYNDLQEGDSVRLFSVRANPMPSCLSEIRLYENGKDPISSAPGMQGGDFSQAFTIGSIIAKFDKNLAPQGMPAPIDFSIPQDTFLVGETLTLPKFPQTYWVNNYPAVSTMLNANTAKFLAHGFTTFTLKDSLSNKCSTSAPQYITGPVQYNAGPDYVACAGEKITVNGTTPETGLWEQVLTNPTYTFAENIGNGKAVLHLGSLAGVYKYIYGSSLEGFDTMQVIVNPKPAVSLEQNFLCTANDNIHAFSNTAGTWFSSDNAVALIDNSGLIQPISKGKVSFTFTEKATGCSNTTNEVIVYKTPAASISEDTLQVAGYALLTPNTGGTWTNSNNQCATYNNAGIVTAVSIGSTNFVFKENNNNLCPSKPVSLTVVSGNLEIIAPVSLCAGSVAILYPRPSDAKWSSDDESVVKVDASGKMTAVGEGSTTIRLSSIQGKGSFIVTVHGLPSNPLKPMQTCVNSTLSIVPQNLNFSWTSSNNNVIEIANGNTFILKNPGSTLISFINEFGCSSDGVEIVVNDRPSLSKKYIQTCIDNSIDLTSIIGDQIGLWSNNGNQVIELNGNMALPLKEGKTSLNFTDVTTACVSDGVIIEVMPKPKVSYTTLDSVAIGHKITLSPNTDKGTWAGYDATIAIINDNNEVEGVKEGSTTFTFVDAAGCTSEPISVKVFKSSIINGVSEANATMAHVYPNPFNDKLIIESNNVIVNVKVYNAYGRLIQSSKSNTIQTSDLITGIYFIEINTSVGKVVKKVTKD
jgi:Secretion system C-terminal sorting domain/Bacterial Ig-like domain (group 2)